LFEMEFRRKQSNPIVGKRSLIIKCIVRKGEFLFSGLFLKGVPNPRPAIRHLAVMATIRAQASNVASWPALACQLSAEVDPQQPFRILYTGRSQPLDVAARCLQFRSPGYSYCTPRGRQRFGGAKCQELRAALVAFITISKCDDRPRAVMGDKAEEVRADCRSLLGLRSAGNTDQRERG
jgi:hypothetical protein